MSNAIAAALALAKAEADATPETTVSAPVATQQAYVPATQTAAPRSLMDFMDNAFMNVEAFLSVSELGLRFGKDKQLHESIDVEMCFKDAKPGYVVRFNSPGAGVIYLTSWDGAQEARSKENWQSVIAQAKKIDGASYPSDLVELPVRLLETGKRKEGGNLDAGKVVGLSLSYQNSKAFAAFLKDQFPRFGMNTPFKVRLSAVAKKGSGQDYGVFGYEVIDDIVANTDTKGKKAA